VTTKALEVASADRGWADVPQVQPHSPSAALRPRLASQRVALAIVMAVATGLRLWGLTHDLPFSYFGDELHFIKRSMALGTGDLNPHWFHKPAFLMYALAFVFGSYFLVGRAVGTFSSVDHFAAEFLVDQGMFLLLGRLLVCASGIALVYLVWLIAIEVYGRWQAAFVAALATAVLPPMVASSQHALSDMPCAFFLVLGFYLYLRSLASDRLLPLALAAAAAGVSMGTKYYGIILVPTFCLWETWLVLRNRREWRRLPLRLGVVVGTFVAAFFLSSPYHFLDPTWGRQLTEQLLHTVGATEGPRFDPDSKTAYTPGPAAWAEAARFFLDRLSRGRALGLTLLGGFILGMLGALRKRKYRDYALLVAIPWTMFLVAASTFAAFHLHPRHLVGILPLACTLLWPALDLLTRPLPLSASGRDRVAIAIAVVALCFPLAETVRANRALMVVDTRTEAYRWILSTLPADAGILVEDHGPVLQPSRLAIDRQKALLQEIPTGPFTFHERQRLRLLDEFPPAEGRNLWQLGHPWWLLAEKDDAELRSSAHDLDMGSPMISRRPATLEEYRAAGVRYVVVNSSGIRATQRTESSQQNFPSFTRFYRSLQAETELIQSFTREGGERKGPEIWIYDLAPTAAAPAPEPG